MKKFENFKLSIISDEISNNFEESLKIISNLGIKNVDIRTIDKINILKLDMEMVSKIKELASKYNINIFCIASPLFKWHANKKEVVKTVDTFGFPINLSLKEKEIYIKKCFEVASILGTKYIRIFSLLNEEIKDFINVEKKLYDLAIGLAKKNNIHLLLENEPSCNFNTINDLLFFKELVPKEIELLLDIGNLYFSQETIEKDVLLKISKYTNYLHIKDYSKINHNYVPLGCGDIPYYDIFKIFNKKEVPTILSIETHSQGDKISDSISSIKKLLNFATIN